jgi:hypothetical protein
MLDYLRDLTLLDIGIHVSYVKRAYADVFMSKYALKIVY